MVVRELEQILIGELGYAGRQGLVDASDIRWDGGRAIPDVNAAINLNNITIAYFSRFTELDTEKIRDLHKKVWSQSKAPMLFVTLPHEVRVYNGY